MLRIGLKSERVQTDGVQMDTTVMMMERGQDGRAAKHGKPKAMANKFGMGGRVSGFGNVTVFPTSSAASSSSQRSNTASRTCASRPPRRRVSSPAGAEVPLLTPRSEAGSDNGAEHALSDAGSVKPPRGWSSARTKTSKCKKEAEGQ